MDSPAEIIRRMLRHVRRGRDDHVDVRQPRPVHRRARVFVRRAPAATARRPCSGEVVRLDRASAPPIGVAEPGDIVEARLLLTDRRGPRDVHGRPDRAARPEHRRRDRPARPGDRDGAETSPRPDRPERQRGDRRTRRRRRAAAGRRSDGARTRSRSRYRPSRRSLPGCAGASALARAAGVRRRASC